MPEAIVHVAEFDLRGLLGDVNQLVVILEERVAGVEPLGQRRGHDAQRQSGRERDQNLEAP